MDKIIYFITNMIPYSLLSAPIYIIVRLIYLKNKEINLKREIVLFIFTLFLIALASQTIIPKIEIDGGIKIINEGGHKTNLIPLKVIKETYYEVFINKHINYFIINFLGNIIMFIPIGFLIKYLWNVEDKKVILIGSSISLFIELLQLFLQRGTDIDDIILNTIGTFIGIKLYELLKGGMKNGIWLYKKTKWKCRKDSRKI